MKGRGCACAAERRRWEEERETEAERRGEKRPRLPARLAAAMFSSAMPVSFATLSRHHHAAACSAMPPAITHTHCFAMLLLPSLPFRLLLPRHVDAHAVGSAVKPRHVYHTHMTPPRHACFATLHAFLCHTPLMLKSGCHYACLSYYAIT